MKFIKLVQLVRTYENGNRYWKITGNVLVNLSNVLYIEALKPAKDEPETKACSIIFMDYDESSCCVFVNCTFEELVNHIESVGLLGLV